MKTGDERYLPARDKGPVRRFVRDWIDARLCVAEMLLPLLIIIMVGQTLSQSLANGLLERDDPAGRTGHLAGRVPAAP